MGMGIGIGSERPHWRFHSSWLCLICQNVKWIPEEDPSAVHSWKLVSVFASGKRKWFQPVYGDLRLVTEW